MKAQPNVYEYEFGVYIGAANEQEAWEKVRAIAEALERVDIERDVAVEGPKDVTALYYEDQE